MLNQVEKTETMHSAIKNIFNTKQWLVGLLAGFMIVAGVVQDAQSATRAQTKQSLVQQLFISSGSSKEKQIVSRTEVEPGSFTSPKLLKSLGLSDEHIQLINEVYDDTFKVNEFFNAKSRRIRDSFHRTHIRKAIRFFQSPLGRKVVQMESDYLNQRGDYDQFLKQLTLSPPDKRRLELMDQLEKARAEVDYDIRHKSSILRTVAPLNDYFAVENAEKLIMKMKMELRDQRRSLHIIDNLYRYRNLSNRDLGRFIRFYESREGKWFNTVDQQGNEDGIAKMNVRAAKRLKSVLQNLESGKEDFDTLKSVFAPGLRYMFTKKRDPFIPQITRVDIEGIEMDKANAKQRREMAALQLEEKKKFESQIQTELEAFPSIPYEVYRTVRKSDPRLTSDLEYYAALFKDKKDMRSMTKSELMEEISNYKDLVQKATNEGATQIGSDLQQDLGSLKLSGIIGNGDKAIALIETPDGFGHTVRKGSLLGPQYSVVQAIDEDKITLMERVRDYQGNIRTQTKYIEFSKPADE